MSTSVHTDRACAFRNFINIGKRERPVCTEAFISHVFLQRGPSFLLQKNRLVAHTRYESTATLHRWTDLLHQKHAFVNVSSLGSSAEGRDLKLITINGGKNLPRIFVDAGIHAREWISPAATIFFVDKLTKHIKR